MKKYLPIQINKEWHLREENPYTFIPVPMFSGETREENYQWANFEKEAIANAKPIINHDGWEWYDSSDLQQVWQAKHEFNGWIIIDESYSWHKDLPKRQAWKYIGEKPVENEIAKLVLNLDVIHDREKLIFSKVEVEELVEAERTSIIGILTEQMKSDGGYNKGHNPYTEMLLTKINNNGNENN